MRFIVQTAALLSGTALALAQPQFREDRLVPDPDRPGQYIAVPAGPREPRPETVVYAYDNWNVPVNIQGHVRTGDHEVGDDIAAVRGTGGIVSGVGWSIFNDSTTESIRDIRIIWRFRTAEGALVGQVQLVTGFFDPVLPQTGRRIFIDDGGFEFFNIIVNDDFFFSVIHADTFGYDPSQLAAMYGGPPNVGSSTRFYRDFTTGQTHDLGSDQRNLIMYVTTRPIPAPGALGVLGVLVLAMRRRRG